MAAEGDILSAEVEAAPGRQRQAADALTRLGFKVLHIGTTISVSAPRQVWDQAFGLPRAEVPGELGELVTGVHFQEPPDFHPL
ncbi:hypothetical protein [Nonomuraea candida]|uniref:hypothetical protein n=1 Tax=Nonomuraea candida TaxID=359159 RepID=UPI000AEF41A1|nr:hypothetical protein [Nonomuraea candida]